MQVRVPIGTGKMEEHFPVTSGKFDQTEKVGNFTQEKHGK